MTEDECNCSGSGSCIHCGGDNTWCPVHYPAPQPPERAEK